MDLRITSRILAPKHDVGDKSVHRISVGVFFLYAPLFKLSIRRLKLEIPFGEDKI